MNQLAVTGVIPLEHPTESDVLCAGALAPQEANQDPIDLAFLDTLKELKMSCPEPTKSHRKELLSIRKLFAK